MVILGISQDSSKAVVVKAIETYGLTFPIILDGRLPGPIAIRWGARNRNCYRVDEEGRIVAKYQVRKSEDGCAKPGTLRLVRWGR